MLFLRRARRSLGGDEWIKKSSFEEASNLAIKLAHCFSSLRECWIEKLQEDRNALYPELGQHRHDILSSKPIPMSDARKRPW